MKKIVIMYLPGYGGFFIAKLLSLDSQVVPYTIATNNIKKRLKEYDFSSALNYNHWSEYDKSNSRVLLEYGKNKGCKFVIDSYHPFELYDYIKTEYDIYLHLHLPKNDFCNYWLMQTKINWGNFPVLRKNELLYEQELLKKHNPFTINMENFLNENSWYFEYEKINEFLNLPLHKDEAQELWSSWYNVRVKKFKENYQILSDKDKDFFFNKRCEDEEQSKELPN
jgi:hypothetical protein